MTGPTYHVIFRTCDIVHSVHHASRPFSSDKRAIIKACFLSLYRSIEHLPHTIHIVGDRLSDEMLSFFGNFPVTISNETLGNDTSIRRQLEIALDKPDGDWVYFCEDDYLHTPECFRNIDDLIRNRDRFLTQRPIFRLRKGINGLAGKPLFIHPPDYPDRYARTMRKYSLLFYSHYCHWRQVTSTTFTFLAEASTIRHYKKIIERSAEGANDRYMSRKLYGTRWFRGRGLCLSPIPGLSTHLHEEVMTPLVNWQNVWDSVVDTSATR